jgi:hypothetical protein
MAIAISPEATSVSGGTFVEPALSLDEIVQRFIEFHILCRILQHSRPFAPGFLVALATFGGT